MKIDKKNIVHWIVLALFAINVIAAILFRPFCNKKSKKKIVLYGHKLSGNLLAIYEYLKAHDQVGCDVVFLTMDQRYYYELIADDLSSVLATRFQCIKLLSKADAVISDHGLHVMSLMLYFSNLKFFDVWHGIPFKGFDAKDFRIQQRYDECWVASPLLEKIYIERFGFRPNKIKITGYARTDVLVKQDKNREQIKRSFGLVDGDIGKIVLFAPTWKQDAQQRSLFPFGMDERAFFRALSELAQRNHATFVMRAHLNSGNGTNSTWPGIVQLPHAQYPDTESLLLVSDILVCDWSSIAFDFLLLNRPTLFLDVEAPFAKGFSLDASYRFGPIIANMGELLELLQRYLNEPWEYEARYSEHAKKIRNDVYGEYADGAATIRCVGRLRTHSGIPDINGELT